MAGASAVGVMDACCVSCTACSSEPAGSFAARATIRAVKLFKFDRACKCDIRQLCMYLNNSKAIAYGAAPRSRSIQYCACAHPSQHATQSIPCSVLQGLSSSIVLCLDREPQIRDSLPGAFLFLRKQQCPHRSLALHFGRKSRS